MSVGRLNLPLRIPGQFMFMMEWSGSCMRGWRSGWSTWSGRYRSPYATPIHRSRSIFNIAVYAACLRGNIIWTCRRLQAAIENCHMPCARWRGHIFQSWWERQQPWARMDKISRKIQYADSKAHTLAYKPDAAQEFRTTFDKPVRLHSSTL